MQQKILMCAPEFYEVDYVINPWMAGNIGQTTLSLAQSQWEMLRQTLAQFVEIVLQPPVRGVPDLVFTANAGMVLGNKVVLSRFRSPERQGEEPHNHDLFTRLGYDIAAWPKDVFFEGAGDALWNRGEQFLWTGYGFRSDERAAKLLEQIYNLPVVQLRLVDPRFYHMDTCLCPLTGGYVMYYPPAFAPESQQAIAQHVPEAKRIIVSEADALHFACNAVDVGGHVVLNDASPQLEADLGKAGFKTIRVPLSEFLKAGGTAKCLTLKLVE